MPYTDEDSDPQPIQYRKYTTDTNPDILAHLGTDAHNPPIKSHSVDTPHFYNHLGKHTHTTSHRHPSTLSNKLICSYSDYPLCALPHSPTSHKDCQ
jgi:hypothetical protein